MHFVFYIVAVFCIGLSSASSARAELYRYVDSRGVCHYSNVPGDSRYKPVPQNTVARKKYKKTTRRRPKVRKYTRNSWPFNRGSGYSVSYATHYDSYAFDKHIARAARVHGIDPLLIKAIIKTESNFNPRAVSSQGAVGLMQLMPGTARDMHVGNRYDARQNILGGTRYIKQLLKSYKGNLSLSLAAYNAGPGRVKNAIPRIPETVAYVSKVLRHYSRYRRESSLAGKTGSLVASRN